MFSWLTQLLGIPVTSETFLTTLRDGVVLCTVANKIQLAAVKYKTKHPETDVNLPQKGEEFGEFGNLLLILGFCFEFYFEWRN